MRDGNRFTIGDAAELAGDVGPDQRLLGVLAELDGPLDLDALRALVGERARRLPVLARRLVRYGRGLRAVRWEPVHIEPGRHVQERVTDDPAAAAIALLVDGLPESVPLWRLLLLRSPGATHLLFVAHHVLLDGAGAVATVAALLGAGDAQPPTAGVPGSRWPAPVGTLAACSRGSSATSLLTPLTSGFRLASVEADLEPLRDAAHRAGATLNDVLLMAVAEALRRVAAGRGERLRRVVVSVPVGRPADAGRNRVGVLLIPVPERRQVESDQDFLSRLASRTRRRKRLARSSSGAPVVTSALLAGIGRLGWYRPLFERQRAITTLLTNLRGPADPLVVLGVRVRSLTPISPALGNVTVVFAAVSHAGRLRVTARLDRSAWDDQEVLTEALRSALTRLATSERT